MKNILVIIDGLANKYINENKYIDIVMPYLSSLRKKYCTCENVFSQGPYTEAALTPLFAGNDNLSQGGNMFRGKYEKTNIYKSFKENGFRTFNYTQPLIYPSSQLINLTDANNGVTFYYRACWDYRLYYYADLKSNGDFNSQDEKICLEILKDNFEYWVKWITLLINHDKEVEFVQQFISDDYDLENILKQVQQQKAIFEQDKSKYLYEVFEQKEGHELFNIQNVEMHNKSDNKIFDYIFNNYADLIKKIEKKAKYTAKEKNLISNLIKKFVLDLNEVGFKQAVSNIVHKYYYFLEKRTKKGFFKEIQKSRSNFKNEPSLQAYFNYFLDWEKGKDDYFANIHVSDIHTPCIFFTIESNDFEEIDKEMSIARELIDKLPKDYKGDIIYTLSMRYCDYKLEQFIEELLHRDSIDNYNIVVTADHGNSFNFTPLRKKLVNNVFEENYNIPFVLVNGGKYNLNKNCYYTSKDIVKTFLDLNNIPSGEFTGSSIVKNEGNNYAITEYLGGGCPDVYRKDFCFIIRDNKYSLSYQVKLNEKFEDGRIVGLYDRQVDKNEFNDLKFKEDKIKYQYLLDILKLRFEEVVSEVKNG